MIMIRFDSVCVSEKYQKAFKISLTRTVDYCSKAFYFSYPGSPSRLIMIAVKLLKLGQKGAFISFNFLLNGANNKLNSIYYFINISWESIPKKVSHCLNLNETCMVYG